MTPTALTDACTQLGWTGLRPLQADIIGALDDGADVLAVLPTGGGKSALYQVPALARPGMVMVVSPLIALMIDQQQRLEAHGVAVGALHSQRTERQRRTDMDRLKKGELDLVYLSPEKLGTLDPRALEGVDVQLVAVDEVHAASEWGHDFRPAYRRIGENLEVLFPQGPPQLLAVTATATPDVISDVKAILRIPGTRPLKTWNTSPDRPNIFFGIVGGKVPVVRLVEHVGTPAIVYGSTRRSVEWAAEELKLHGFRADFYHAGRKKKDRVAVQEAFKADELEVITATNAFGMGVDKANIRGVVHLELPTSIEAYLQEAGRAGRDGKPAMAVCRATKDVIKVAAGHVKLQWPNADFVQHVWTHLKPHFLGRQRGAQGSLPVGQLQGTIAELAVLLGVSPFVLGPALRVLVDAGALQWVEKRELPVSVTLLSLAMGWEEEPFATVIDNLFEHADADGHVWGSVRFFEEQIGLDKKGASAMNMAGLIQVRWARKGRLYKLLTHGEPNLDRPHLDAIHKRQLKRLSDTERYLWWHSCRRRYLVSYFGHQVTSALHESCCDRCRQLAKKGA